VNKSELPTRSIGGRLLLLSLLLLLLPWLGYQYVQEMKNFVLQGQEKAQILTAQAIATVMHDRHDLFDPRSFNPSSLTDSTAFYSYTIPSDIQVDGYFTEWGDILGRSYYFRNLNDTDSNDSPTGFRITLGTRHEYLYAAIQVYDNSLVYRHPGYLRLDSADHIRLTVIDSHGKLLKFVLLAEGPGRMSVYMVRDDWKFAQQGAPVSDIVAVLHERSGGYDVELKLPLKYLGNEMRMRISISDVTADSGRKIKSLVHSLPAAWSEELNRVIVRSPELERILSGLSRSDARIWVVDRQRRIRAYVNVSDSEDSAPGERLDENLVAQALSGNSHSERIGDEFGSSLILASHPIYDSGQVIGAVVIQQNIKDILALQRQTLFHISIWTSIVFIIILLVLLLFTSRLAWRLRSLNRETSNAINEKGQVEQTTISSNNNARDELGQLSRSISDMLCRLQRYHRFLENIPRTLRHEINNPLNVISTSLQNLAEHESGLKQNQYLQSAERGINRLGMILERLSEAASLEDALTSEDHEIIDLARLVSAYTESCKYSHADTGFIYSGPTAGLFIQGNDLRIEQMLDKLVDNAIDFSDNGYPVRISLTDRGATLELEIRNTGPAIPASIMQQGFTSMLSIRNNQADTERPHLGLGLYVARIIAEYHKGHMTAENIIKNNEVRFSVQLPKIDYKN
jgi:signal transduction histidine kinase